MDYRILVADGNEDILKFLVQVFSKNYELYFLRSAEETLHILDQSRPELVIADIGGKAIDGLELCKLIKSNIKYCHIPVILLTVENDPQLHIEVLEAGADLFIQKPFPAKLLHAQVANLLKNRLKIKEHFTTSAFKDVRVMAHSKADEAFLKKLDNYIITHMTDLNLNVDQLADHMNMSRPTLYRKTKSLSKLSPKELIDTVRLKKAAQLIAQNEFTMFEIARMVGYSSQSVFNKNFQRYFKQSPNKYGDALEKPSERLSIT